jgi:hypothetical protein
MKTGKKNERRRLGVCCRAYWDLRCAFCGTFAVPFYTHRLGNPRYKFCYAKKPAGKGEGSRREETSWRRKIYEGFVARPSYMKVS